MVSCHTVWYFWTFKNRKWKSVRVLRFFSFEKPDVNASIEKWKIKIHVLKVSINSGERFFKHFWKTKLHHANLQSFKQDSTRSNSDYHVMFLYSLGRDPRILPLPTMWGVSIAAKRFYVLQRESERERERERYYSYDEEVEATSQMTWFVYHNTKFYLLQLC